MLIDKIKSEKSLLSIVRDLKANGKKIVTYNGSFDLLHSGHIKAIFEAKSEGDILVILLNSDKSVASYKSSKRPIVDENGRAEILAAISAVDYVCLFDDINPKRILSKIKPDVHANGADWGRDCLERDVVERNGGRIHILKWTTGRSTSNLIKKILESYKSPLKRAVFIDRDGTINDNGAEGYIHKKNDFKFLPKVVTALKKLSKTDYKIIIITNQSGIGRGFYTEADMTALHRHMMRELKKFGVRVDAIYHCPHSPDAPCRCRKPAPGMVYDAVKDFDVSLNDSWMIGDSDKDVLVGREVNMKTIKIGERMSAEHKVEPHYYVADLSEAINVILNK